MIYIDTHCHIDFAVFTDDREQVLNQCKLLNISHLIVPGVSEESWETLIHLSKQYSPLMPAIGLHPCFLQSTTQQSLKKLEDLLKKEPEILAIGETGLDFFIDNPDRKKQQNYFEKQVFIANEHQLPLILHVRKAHDEVLKILKRSRFQQGGVVHCYSGSLQQAENYLKLGFKLGIGGVITYERSRRLQKVVSELSLSSFVIETDAPDIPPLGKERERNSPEYLPQIFKAFASHRKESQAEIAAALINNTKEIFPKLGSAIE